MTIRPSQLEPYEEESPESRPRFARIGKLVPASGAPEAAQTRCSCDRCGAHLLAIDRQGVLDGQCAVCMGRAFTPVGRPSER